MRVILFVLAAIVITAVMFSPPVIALGLQRAGFIEQGTAWSIVGAWAVAMMALGIMPDR